MLDFFHFFVSDLTMVMKPGMPSETEEKKLATWGTDIPDDLVLDKKLLSKAIKKVNFGASHYSQRPVLFYNFGF
ncbi:hypothetical protein U1Q18_006293 [Sarracenia purpurea var. burkii]